ncbi:ABC transporter permease [Nocardioides cynanchi]|uniref:ABC transporter permease n=1 Tax=Nocardioides cynanchi TaxID=2558918 RepID=UPI001246757C|nr:ABC transporter permease [Nocardioides cynanchi]
MSLVAEPGLVADSEQTDDQTRRRGYPTYVLIKVLGSAGSLLFMLLVNFFLFRVLPGDPVRTLGRGHLNTPAQVAAFKKAYGLDQPLGVQFLTFLKQTAHGDLGLSLQFRRPVSELIWQAMGPTLLLVGSAAILSTLIGVYLGIRGAWNRGGVFDRISTGTSLTLYAMPEWWLGLILIAGLGVGFWFVPGIFPTGGLHSPDVNPNSLHGILDTTWHLTLPVVTLTLAYLADFSLIMRSSLLDELGEDYLQTARAKGLRDVQVRNRHAVRNALLPTTTVIALNIGFVVSGAITVETVFSIPGLGLLSTNAIGFPDFPVLQGTFLVASAGVIAANLAANLVYGLLDPRVRT